VTRLITELESKKDELRSLLIELVQNPQDWNTQKIVKTYTAKLAET
jgi:hypothetical protein